MATTFSLLGHGLKLDTRADIEPHLAKYDPTLIEEIHLGGNTIGVEAAQALAEFLAKTTQLRVRACSLTMFPSIAHEMRLATTPLPISASRVRARSSATSPDRQLCRHLHWPPDN